MLKISILAIGKDKEPWVTGAVTHYLKLLNRFAQVEIQAVASPKLSPAYSPGEIIAHESAKLRNKIPSSTYVVTLDERGKQLASDAFAEWLNDLQTVSGGRVVFLIGGPYGLAPSLIREAGFHLSLSPLTFSHQLVRLVLLEQLYRGFSILNNTGYHK